MILNDINNQLTHSPEFFKTENECSSKFCRWTSNFFSFSSRLFLG